MRETPPEPQRGLHRRGFLGLSGAALICGVGGQRISLKTASDVDEADAAARRMSRPHPVDEQAFPTPKPQPGGRTREYWIQARSMRWNVAPTGHDEWMNHRIRGRKTFRTIGYQLMSPGFAEPWGRPRIPGPALEAEVGDVIVVHFRNDDERFEQAHTMHPHGVRYTPDHDGSYLGRFTRPGGFVAPGEEFTYHWEATPDSVGIWPYHDHGPNHTINTLRGMFGAIVIRPKGTPKPDVEQVLVMHSFPPQVTKIDRLFQCFNGRTGAGNTPTVRAKVGQDVAFHVYGGDGAFHTWHVHGHRWRDASGAFVDSPTIGPNESLTARWREDNPGRWLYHCHVFDHQDAGMAGWYIVEP